MLIGIVANEPSGDLLGAALIRALRAQLPTARFVGVAGPQMLAAGCETVVNMERLTVMGLTEVLAHLPELLRLRQRLRDYFCAERPAVVIGIDAPDFNLGLERQLRAVGITTVHFVSPTVWAWRAGRVKTIRRAVDLLLCLFPFEAAFLTQHGINAVAVGHPLADEIPLTVDRAAARLALGLAPTAPVIALLPGSRVSEMQRLAAPFIDTAVRCHAARPQLQFVVPLVNATLRELFAAEVARRAPQLPLTLVDGRSRDAITAADCVLTASGTATLETLLLNRPMVVAYRLNALTYQVVKQLKLVKVPFIALANLLAGRELAPEFIQDRCRAELLAPALLHWLDHPAQVADIQAIYSQIHRELRVDAAAAAAAAVVDLMQRRAA
ncbi:lipid-A-disaccharide synthase [Chromatium okenii]|uniref:lipid-A-disaccharide synthase n=1 Tax=Chromatium okenii TaxID=61644 RepID=UPI0019059B83|nr:lipid-A-disaccharide synthase [Chromatium okenii]MBK1640973.1 lipid-A-disaccharide synthase [Chromatium okenii]